MLLTRELERSEFYKERIPELFKQLATFSFVTFAWIFFRAASFNDALLIINRIFAFTFRDFRFPLLALFLCLSIWFYQFIHESKIKGFLELAPVRAGAMLFIFIYLFIVGGTGHEAFIYFQF